VLALAPQVEPASFINKFFSVLQLACSLLANYKIILSLNVVMCLGDVVGAEVLFAGNRVISDRVWIYVW